MNIEASNPISVKDICDTSKQDVLIIDIAMNVKMRKFMKLPNQFRSSVFILD